MCQLTADAPGADGRNTMATREFQGGGSRGVYKSAIPSHKSPSPFLSSIFTLSRTWVAYFGRAKASGTPRCRSWEKRLRTVHPVPPLDLPLSGHCACEVYCTVVEGGWKERAGQYFYTCHPPLDFALVDELRRLCDAPPVCSPVSSFISRE
jgi:hypothetical protein